MKLLGLMVVVVSLAGCQASREAAADPIRFTPGTEFTLGGGQEAVSSADDLRVRFADVLEDSRCPTEVECFWTGQARIAVDVGPVGVPPTTVLFNTNPAPGQNVQTAGAGQYPIVLKALEPHPRTPDEPIAFEDYRATLVMGG